MGGGRELRLGVGVGGEGGGVPFLLGCIPDCAEDPGRHTKPELAAAPGSSHAARQPTSGTQDSGGEQEHKNIQGGGWKGRGGGGQPPSDLTC